jgi:hypothetical protein
VDQLLKRLIEDFKDTFQPASRDELKKRSETIRKWKAPEWIETPEKKRTCHLCRRGIYRGEKMIRIGGGYRQAITNLCHECLVELGRVTG